MSENNDVSLVELCRSLTGVGVLSERHAKSIIARARKSLGDAEVDHLTKVFDQGGLVAINADQRATSAARIVTYALYTGFFIDAAGKREAGPLDDPSDYFDSVIWPALQAHPPGLSGGYFGHWHYPPEDADG